MRTASQKELSVMEMFVPKLKLDHDKSGSLHMIFYASWPSIPCLRFHGYLDNRSLLSTLLSINKLSTLKSVFGLYNGFHQVDLQCFIVV